MVRAQAGSLDSGSYQCPRPGTPLYQHSCKEGGKGRGGEGERGRSTEIISTVYM